MSSISKVSFYPSPLSEISFIFKLQLPMLSIMLFCVETIIWLERNFRFRSDIYGQCLRLDQFYKMNLTWKPPLKINNFIGSHELSSKFWLRLSLWHLRILISFFYRVQRKLFWICMYIYCVIFSKYQIYRGSLWWVNYVFYQWKLESSSGR